MYCGLHCLLELMCGVTRVLEVIATSIIWSDRHILCSWLLIWLRHGLTLVVKRGGLLHRITGSSKKCLLVLVGRG